MNLGNSKMKLENLKLKSQPKGTMAKWKSAKLIEHKTMTKVTQNMYRNRRSGTSSSFLNLNIVLKDENHYHSAQLLIHMYIRNKKLFYLSLHLFLSFVCAFRVILSEIHLIYHIS